MVSINLKLKTKANAEGEYYIILQVKDRQKKNYCDRPFGQKRTMGFQGTLLQN